MTATMKEALDLIENIVADSAFIQDSVDLLVDICKVDTTPNANISIMRDSENLVFDRLKEAMSTVDADTVYKPVNPEIKNHPAFSLLHFTKTDDCPEGLSAEETYKDRGNLLFTIKPEAESDSGQNVALNAHIDVVAPYYPPYVEGNTVFGRGACDDKAGIVVMVKVAQIMQKLKEQGLKLNKKLTLMCVIEEETGGNGSLSLALDRELKKEYDSLMVLECADMGLHPANRGAVWYKTVLQSSASLLEMAAFSILEMEKEGAAIKAESAHPLFPQRPVQTCHGMIGQFGEHPSRICAHVAFTVEKKAGKEQLSTLIDSAVDKYIDRYGDKSKVIDPTTGKVKVEKHTELTEMDDGFKVDVYGSAGHMGSIMENDGAITKMAYIVHEIYTASKANPVNMTLVGEKDGAETMVLEGGQGFVPTHDINQVMERMSSAAERGMKCFLEDIDNNVDAECCTTYEKLHNDAFETDPNSDSMKNAITAMETCELRKPGQPIDGWTVSCDSRLFAGEYPELPVITTGPGQLNDAHSDHESVKVADMMDAIKFISLYVLKETGTIK